ncbi:molybdenum cofactor synthesis protein cinnamon [Contarinia nasturtii]|uniref:molybdenum cofactor synthesis protein cinnamon n=1 Tax=Contarinia nasturtii TaxID=265458 RepID=UPI0012D4394E|nr:molybdenum cofactor synthesis protein cinnamon [Contarinia nasturtii]XP_031635111.1 molybdenum cofactor synthesis protein cinnamon [Contarinia nasturtii]XP_031635112.1 molybdenum cofactor synthesis protein cinnamon [Contarinia nasturtii]
MNDLRVGIITVSDRCSSGEAEDKSGQKLRNLVTKFFDASITSALIPDEMDRIEAELLRMADQLSLQLILTTGGTGFSPRDVTPEATRNVIQKEANQLSLAMSLCSFQKTQFAALSRAVCGIRNKTLICNMPGSPKAVEECFMAIVDVLPHAIDLINGHQDNVRKSHGESQAEQIGQNTSVNKHICPHKTGTGGDDDRNSPFPMIPVEDALLKIFNAIKNVEFSHQYFKSPINIPEFRASIKDGYAVKANGSCKGVKKVIGYISAGEDVIRQDFDSDSCFKINTGAAVPDFANAIVQVEDTKLIKAENEIEQIVDILLEPTTGLDIRPVGSDLAKGDLLFKGRNDFPDIVVYKSLLASVGVAAVDLSEVHICILSTGDELTEPGQPLKPGKIYDSNTTMLRTLLELNGFKKISTLTLSDTFNAMHEAIKTQAENNTFIICSGSVSMGDKDFLKPVLKELGFKIYFGRVNMKPGKPMTFAARETTNTHSYLFGLPGNPVSAFATFHLFVLPALRKYCGYSEHKLSLPIIYAELLNTQVELDPRPEYARAQISFSCRQGKFFAEITDNQISSRLTSITDADVLLHLPPRTKSQEFVVKGTQLKASVLKHHFISKYLD